MSMIGLDETMRWADMAIKTTKKSLKRAFDSSAKKMEEKARSRHKFTTRTGAIDKSITGQVKLTADYLSLLFFIDTKVQGIILPSGYNKGWMMNDGTYGNYKRGFISPSSNTVGGKKGSGWKGDDFMGRTWKTEYPKLEKRINKIMDGIR